MDVCGPWFAWRPVRLSVWLRKDETPQCWWRKTWRVAWFRWVTRWMTVNAGTVYEDADGS